MLLGLSMLEQLLKQKQFFFPACDSYTPYLEVCIAHFSAGLCITESLANVIFVALL